jgi:hypothetical protein
MRQQQLDRVSQEVAESLPKEKEIKPDGSNDNSNRKRVNKQQLPNPS